MNLANTIEILSGGPGSGCRGPNCGRKKTLVAPRHSSVAKEVTVDFDNTVARHVTGNNMIGEPLPNGLAIIHELQRKGYHVTILTARPDTRGVEKFLAQWGVKNVKATNVKPNAAAYVDDRAVNWTGNQSVDEAMEQIDRLSQARAKAEAERDMPRRTNLHAAIWMWAGGPGSGCQGPNCGRPEGTGIPQEVYDRVAQHQQVFSKTYERFKRIVGEYGELAGRVKSPESAYEKMQRKGKSIEQMGDMIGMRVSTRTAADVYQAVNDIRRNFNVVKEEDKLKNPLGTYRAYHMDVDLGNGIKAEVQLRTENESKLAQMAHNTTYKGALKNDPDVNRYFMKLSNALYRIDRRQKSQLPPCPDVVRQKVGCFA